jgi:hypothetical protein
MKLMMQIPIRYGRYDRYDSIRLFEKPLRRSGFRGSYFRYGRYANPTYRGDFSPLYGSYRIVLSLGIRSAIRFGISAPLAGRNHRVGSGRLNKCPC